jgi:hypothetical protein
LCRQHEADPVEKGFRCKQCRDNSKTGVGYNKIIHRAASVAYIVSFLCSLVRNIVTQTELVFLWPNNPL